MTGGPGRHRREYPRMWKVFFGRAGSNTRQIVGHANVCWNGTVKILDDCWHSLTKFLRVFIPQCGKMDLFDRVGVGVGVASDFKAGSQTPWGFPANTEPPPSPPEMAVEPRRVKALRGFVLLRPTNRPSNGSRIPMDLPGISPRRLCWIRSTFPSSYTLFIDASWRLFGFLVGGHAQGSARSDSTAWTSAGFGLCSSDLICVMLSCFVFAGSYSEGISRQFSTQATASARHLRLRR